MNKTEFLEALRAERARLDRKLARLSEAQLTERAAPDTWSIKDNLAHLTYWEQYMLDKVRRAMEAGETPKWVTSEQETAINAQLFADNRERPLAEVLAAMRRSFEQVVGQVQALSDEDLTDPARFAWMKKEPLWKYIEAECCGEHCEEHLGKLLA